MKTLSLHKIWCGYKNWNYQSSRHISNTSHNNITHYDEKKYLQRHIPRLSHKERSGSCERQMVHAGAARTVEEVSHAFHRAAQHHRRRNAKNAVGIAQDVGGGRDCVPQGLPGDSSESGVFAHLTGHGDAQGNAAAHRLGDKKHGGDTARPWVKTTAGRRKS